MEKLLERVARPTGLTGDVTGLRGDVTGLTGDVDRCELTDAERIAGVNVSDLVR